MHSLGMRPENTNASPDGWVVNDETLGDNVVVYKDDESNIAASPFTYEYDDTVGPTEKDNVAASTVNAFYLINTVHDMWHEYGFTEEAFNFQDDNYGEGSEGRDRVLLSVQDASVPTMLTSLLLLSAFHLSYLLPYPAD